MLGCVGFFAPQLVQKFPLLVAPQEQVQLVAGAGFFAPQLVQKFPVFEAPQEQVQAFAFTGDGFGLPQTEQKLPFVT